MTSPLKIMSKIESHEPMVDDVTSDLGEWQSLRKAIEAERSSYQAKIADQAEELSRLHEYDKRLTEVMLTDFKSWHENSPEEWPEIAASVIKNLREREAWALEQLAQKDARIARLKSLFDEGFNSGDEHDLDAWEAKAKEVLNETDRQSLSAVKAEALREAADVLSSKGLQFTYTYIDWLEMRANDIEQEAK